MSAEPKCGSHCSPCSTSDTANAAAAGTPTALAAGGLVFVEQAGSEHQRVVGAQRAAHPGGQPGLPDDREGPGEGAGRERGLIPGESERVHAPPGVGGGEPGQVLSGAGAAVPHGGDGDAEADTVPCPGGQALGQYQLHDLPRRPELGVQVRVEVRLDPYHPVARGVGHDLAHQPQPWAAPSGRGPIPLRRLMWVDPGVSA